MVFYSALGYSRCKFLFRHGFMNQPQAAAPGKQELKSERARDIICKATVKCLAELGYGETSINRVVTQAGVSKGALQHHFPSKEELMASTASYLLQKPLRFVNRARDGHALRDEFLSIWHSLTNTKAYLALLEILVAARTDRVLHKRIAANLKTSIRDIDDHFVNLYGNLEAADERELRLLMCANRCLMRGLLIEAQYGLAREDQLAVLDCWLDLVVPRFAGLDSRS